LVVRLTTPLTVNPPEVPPSVGEGPLDGGAALLARSSDEDMVNDVDDEAGSPLLGASCDALEPLPDGPLELPAPPDVLPEDDELPDPSVHAPQVTARTNKTAQVT
jgi:hypothetical protein